MLDKDAEARIADQWRHQFVPDIGAIEVSRFDIVATWAFDDWPDLALTLSRLRMCAEAGAIGAALDAMYVIEFNRHKFWRGAQKPIRPADTTVLDLGASLPGPPTWALATLARSAADPGALHRHRKNIIHRLRFDAAVSIERIRLIWREERIGHDGMPSLQALLIRAGEKPTDAKSKAEKEIKRFTKDLVKGNKYEIVSKLFEKTVLHANWEAMKLSHEKVQKSAQKGEAPMFHLPTDQALTLLGWHDLAGMSREIDARIGRLFARP